MIIVDKCLSKFTWAKHFIVWIFDSFSSIKSIPAELSKIVTRTTFAWYPIFSSFVILYDNINNQSIDNVTEINRWYILIYVIM